LSIDIRRDLACDNGNRICFIESPFVVVPLQYIITYRWGIEKYLVDTRFYGEAIISLYTG
jgi:hypothetical protein